MQVTNLLSYFQFGRLVGDALFGRGSRREPKAVPCGRRSSAVEVPTPPGVGLGRCQIVNKKRNEALPRPREERGYC